LDRRRHSAAGRLGRSDLDRTVTVPSCLDRFCIGFGTSTERIAIIDGFLGYRSELHAVGLTRGFQWIDGSFLENVEVLRSRPPKDVDVVTFYELPSGETQASILGRNPGVFDHDQLNARFSVDAFTQDLGSPSQDLIGWSAYWYGVWSHQRSTLVWKGFVEVDLDPSQDAGARAILLSTKPAGGSP
jgi:hypothetical protein